MPAMPAAKSAISSRRRQGDALDDTQDDREARQLAPAGELVAHRAQCSPRPIARRGAVGGAIAPIGASQDDPERCPLNNALHKLSTEPKASERARRDCTTQSSTWRNVAT